jgi:hypothetical protein
MKLRCTGWFLTAAAAFAAPDAPLPGWNDIGHTEQEVADWVAGETLLAEEAQPAEQPDLPLIEPASEGVAGDGANEEIIPESYWAEYFGKRPEKFLIDPQNLLAPEEYRERLAFLNYHAGDSAIDLFVYVIGGDQAVPGEVRALLHGRAAAGDDASEPVPHGCGSAAGAAPGSGKLGDPCP